MVAWRGWNEATAVKSTSDMIFSGHGRPTRSHALFSQDEHENNAGVTMGGAEGWKLYWSRDSGVMSIEALNIRRLQVETVAVQNLAFLMEVFRQRCLLPFIKRLRVACE